MSSLIQKILKRFLTSINHLKSGNKNHLLVIKPLLLGSLILLVMYSCRPLTMTTADKSSQNTTIPTTMSSLGIETGVQQVDVTKTPADPVAVDPYENMYINSLTSRAIGGGKLEEIEKMIDESTHFSRYFFRYPSEGMEMYGFIDIPDADGTYPVIILLHGDVSRKYYSVVTYTARYADALADKGYIVIHPNLRGYPPSPDAENQLGVGDTVDTLNLLSIVREQAGKEGLLKKADASNIGLFGHSMGGGIVMRVMVIDHDIKAGLLYASINADEELNLAYFKTEDGRGYKKIQAPPESLAKISPLNYLNRINAPVFIVHGSADTRVPLQWSEMLYKRLQRLGKDVTFKIYQGEYHTFRDKGDVQFISDSIDFFDQYLKS